MRKWESRWPSKGTDKGVGSEQSKGPRRGLSDKEDSTHATQEIEDSQHNEQSEVASEVSIFSWESDAECQEDDAIDEEERTQDSDSNE